MVNYANIARDCGVIGKTVENYYQILVDTLPGYFLPLFHKNAKRDVITKTEKFYFFDVGFANFLAKRSIIELRGTQAGEAFEHFIFIQLVAYKGLQKNQAQSRFYF